ncbi:hypothetical protein FB45DRAFT_915746 [Roridomyces roridus]|uniref:F-box domain-containing protein n=1 Tax=Roridomyces roridus TaxID=1738132 RepID=A0AAD7FNG9_9AGAR|nr:hypothetical protein FB45DRAFT_915746 [Roridomyces roridus]
MLVTKLPAELLEHILLELVLSGEANSCCHLLHDLVHSIWRELYLAIFDDPRPKIALKASPVQQAYEWKKFTEHIRAANRIHAGDPACQFPILLDLLATAAPVQASHALEEPVLEQGYPPVLTQRFQRSFMHDGSVFSRPEFEDTPEGQSFYKLAFLRGFVPSSVPEDDVGPSQRWLRSSAKGHHHEMALARALARTRVYNTKWLMAERCWGPFQPLDPAHPNAYTWRNRLCQPPATDSQDEGLALRSASPHMHRSVHPSSILLTTSLLDADEDIDDADYNPTDSDSDSDTEDTPHLLHFLSSHGIDFADQRTHPTYVFPAPHRVVPDYAFLSAARLVLEANMREIFERETFRTSSSSSLRNAATDVGLELHDIVDAMQSLDLTRMGGAPGFWNVWRPESAEDEEEDEKPAPVDKGKGKANDDEVEGWDWAGVTGEWRRVVCWLDYRDLLSMSFFLSVGITSAGFGTEDIQETIRIFPMRLSVSHYSSPPRPPPGADPRAPLYRLPVIHVKGESWGTDIDEMSRRAIEGSVRMIGDGAVRWSMTSSEMAGSDPEWVTECVQVGDIGSAAGIIGLWTGAEHSATDPLGPCWAWKVA